MKSKITYSKVYLVVLIGLMVFSDKVLCQSNIEIYLEWEESLKKTENELKDVYEKILLKYASDSTFISTTKKSQQTWLKFRDAELAMMFPIRELNVVRSGDICEIKYLMELTRQRIKKLTVWLRGHEEEDECEGSVKGK